MILVIYIQEGENNIAISKEYTDTTCLYVYTTSYIMINEGLELQNYQRLYQMYYKDLDIKSTGRFNRKFQISCIFGSNT